MLCSQSRAASTSTTPLQWQLVTAFSQRSLVKYVEHTQMAGGQDFQIFWQLQLQQVLQDQILAATASQPGNLPLTPVMTWTRRKTHVVF